MVADNNRSITLGSKRGCSSSINVRQIAQYIHKLYNTIDCWLVEDAPVPLLLCTHSLNCILLLLLWLWVKTEESKETFQAEPASVLNTGLYISFR